VLAHVRIGRVVVTINTPICFYCIAERGNAYNSVAGMKAAIRALRPR
jgi:hypothetical protein